MTGAGDRQSPVCNRRAAGAFRAPAGCAGRVPFSPYEERGTCPVHTAGRHRAGCRPSPAQPPRIALPTSSPGTAKNSGRPAGRRVWEQTPDSADATEGRGYNKLPRQKAPIGTAIPNRRI